MIAAAETIAGSASEAARFLLALLALLTFAQIGGLLFVRLKMPRVVGEITGGLLLGPTGLGALAPEVHAWFYRTTQPLSLIYWLGLVALMFISGFEVQKSVTRGDRKMVIALLLGATAIPCLAGWLAPSFYDFSPYMGHESNAFAFQIVVAISVAVTSIPVISRIFLDLKIMDGRFAKIVLATATIQDVLLWIALAVATGMVGTRSLLPLQVTASILIALSVFIVVLLIIPSLARKLGSAAIKFDPRSPLHTVSLAVLLTVAAGFLNVNLALAAFLAGVVMGICPQNKAHPAYGPVRKLAIRFLIPVYFGMVGLKLDLIRQLDVTFLLGFLAFTSALEISASMLAIRFLGKDWLTSLNFGVAMNTRGGPGIILATIAFEAGIINEVFFLTLVATAVVTSLVTGSWLRFVLATGRPLLNESTSPTLPWRMNDTKRAQTTLGFGRSNTLAKVIASKRR
jgi:Kef-type K+ transport system membrane component KefB